MWMLEKCWLVGSLEAAMAMEMKDVLLSIVGWTWISQERMSGKGENECCAVVSQGGSAHWGQPCSTVTKVATSNAEKFMDVTRRSKFE